MLRLSDFITRRKKIIIKVRGLYLSFGALQEEEI